MSWLDNNSSSSGAPGVAFDVVGAEVAGVITAPPKEVETQYGSRLVIEIEAAGGCTATAGEDRKPIAAGDPVTIWLKPGAMASAVRNALRDEGVDGLAVGGRIAVTYAGDGERKPGKNPPKLYAAAYAAPKPTVPLGTSML